MAKSLSYSVSRTPDGGYRVHLGDNKYVQRKTRLGINSVIQDHKMARINRGKELADAPPGLVAKLLALHYRCETAGTSVADAVDFWIPHYAAKTASVPLADAIDMFIANCRAQGLARATVNERVHRLGLWLGAQPEPEVTVFEAAEVTLTMSKPCAGGTASPCRPTGISTAGRRKRSSLISSSLWKNPTADRPSSSWSRQRACTLRMRTPTTNEIYSRRLNGTVTAACPWVSLFSVMRRDRCVSDLYWKDVGDHPKCTT